MQDTQAGQQLVVGRIADAFCTRSCEQAEHGESHRFGKAGDSKITVTSSDHKYFTKVPRAKEIKHLSPGSVLNA